MPADVESIELKRTVEQLTAQVARIADHLEKQNAPLAWHQRPIGYGLVGTILFLAGVNDHILFVAGGLLFVCSAIVGAKR